MGAQQDIDQKSSTDINLSTPDATRYDGIYTGHLVGFKEACTPLVILPQEHVTAAQPARSIVDLHGEHIGSEVVIQFENGDLSRPIIMGVIRTPSAWPMQERPQNVTVEADDERLTLSAKNQIVLRCGKASITLTQAGKVLIKGTYISSRSSGANRIKGGSILLN